MQGAPYSGEPGVNEWLQLAQAASKNPDLHDKLAQELPIDPNILLAQIQKQQSPQQQPGTPSTQPAPAMQYPVGDALMGGESPTPAMAPTTVAGPQPLSTVAGPARPPTPTTGQLLQGATAFAPRQLPQLPNPGTPAAHGAAALTPHPNYLSITPRSYPIGALLAR